MHELNLDTKITVDVEHKPVSSLPVEPSPSPVGTIGADILPPKYSDTQHQTWAMLYERQDSLLKGRVCEEYINARAHLQFPATRIPHLRDLSGRLQEISGWQLVRVDGLVAGEYFFPMLKNRTFPGTDFIRHPHELEYTPAPDMFHDLMGHVPLLCNLQFAEFFHQFGSAGVNALGNEKLLTSLGAIYWFTVEFGLMNPTAHEGTRRDPHLTSIYGAGLVSSVGEMTHCLTSEVKKHPFDINHIAQRSYNIYEMQTDLFEITGLEELQIEFERWARAHGLL